MKKVCLLAVLLVFIITLSACGKTAEPEQSAMQTEAATVEVSSEPEPTPEPTPDLNDPMTMVGTVLSDPQVIFSEDANAMDANGGSNFGDVAIKQLSADGNFYKFISNDDGAYMIGNLNFLDVGEFRGNAQAIMFKFQPENVDGLFFTLYGAGEILMQFHDGQPYLVHVQDSFEAPYSDYMPTNLTLEDDKWYWAMMAMDKNGYYRSMIWEDGNAANMAYCAENMGDWHEEYKGSNWHLTIGFGANQTLYFQEYRVMDFDGYTDMENSDSDSIAGGGMQDPFSVISKIVEESQVLYQDTLDSFPDRGYTMYSNVADKHPGDGFEFVTDDGTDRVDFLSPLIDVVPKGERKDNMTQAVLVCFKVDNPETLKFELSATETLYVTFQDGGHPDCGIAGREDLNPDMFGEETPTDFQLQAGKWYYAFFAITAPSHFRFKVWDAENPEDYSYYGFELAAYTDEEHRPDFWQQNWNFGMVIGNNARLNLMEFDVLDFSEIISPES